MKRLFFILTCTIAVLLGQESRLTVPDSSKPLTTIAVLPLEGKGISVPESEILTERLRSALVQDGRYEVVERSQMDEIMKEQGFQQTGCLTDECLVQAGLILGATQMVNGTVGRIGFSFAIDVRLFDVETAKIIKAVTRDHRGSIDELLQVMTEIAVELAGERPQRTVPTTTSPPSKDADVEEMVDQVIEAFDHVKTALSDETTKFRPPLEGKNIKGWFPFQLSLFYPYQLVPSSFDIYGWRISIIYGKNRNLLGIDTGFLIREIEDTLIGYQAGFYNISGKVYGMQNGFLNVCDYLYGVQFGFINKCKYLKGVQIGILNLNSNGGGQPFMPIINVGF